MEPWNLLKAMADKTRLRILVVLSENELCVDDLEKILKLPQSNVSRHLAKLLTSGLIASRRESRHVYYLLNNNPGSFFPPIRNLLMTLRLKEDFSPDLVALDSFIKSKTTCLSNASSVFREEDLI